MRFNVLFYLLFLFSTILTAQDTSQTFLPLNTTNVDKFLAQNPEYDGRGTLVFILDTGVDMGVDGLTVNSIGETKVIDVKDFTGQGDIKISKADIKSDNGINYLKKDDLIIKGIDNLSLKPVDNKYYIGSFKEERFLNSNSKVSDINRNGKRDEYAIIVFETNSNNENFWTAYFDTDADGFMDDEKSLRNYSEKFDTFHILNPNQPPYFTFALNIYPGQELVNLFFDDGGHGTHVAGIASGFQIGESYNFNGVAPGSKIIALKIGENTLSGGATVTESMKRAFQYVDSLSRIVKEPCIINLSYGIGSVYEGYSDMELYLEALLKNNPYLYVCTSNGNNGPGISSAGLPAASRYVFSSGAIMTKEVGRDLYGASLNEDIILHFSSRGGEVAKPDIAAPGACVSTVTNFTTLDRFWGTSMASPYTAGVMSLLLSAVKQKYSDLKIHSQLLYKVIRESAVKMEGYNYLDQGTGGINALAAYNLLEEYIRNNEITKFEDYVVSSFAPGMPENRSQNLYIRNGLMIDEKDTFRFSVKRVNSKEKFYRIFDLESDSDWLMPIQKKIHMRNLQGAGVSVKFDMTKLSEPGIYNGIIKAYRSDKSRFPEFDLMASIIIPYEFNSGNNFKLNRDTIKLSPGRHKRFFLNVPAGTSSMIINMSSVNNHYGETIYRLFDPDGVNIYTSSMLNTDFDEKEVSESLYQLKPGVYELVLHANYMAKELSTVELSVELLGLNPLESVVVNDSLNKVSIVNYFNKQKDYKLQGSLLGYKKEFKTSINGNDSYEYPFVLRRDEDYKEFTISIRKEDFNKMTDFSVLIYDDTGYAVEKEGYNYPEEKISLSNTKNFTDSANYKLVIIPAFTNKHGSAEIKLLEETYISYPAGFEVFGSKEQQMTFYPGVEKKVELNIQAPTFYYPKDTVPFGRIYFHSGMNDKVELEIPFLYKQ